MRVAYLLKKFPRLSETFILTELCAQESRGVDLCVFSRRAPDDEPRHAALETLRAPIEVFPRYADLDPWSLIFQAGEAGLDEAGWARLRPLVHDLGPLVGERFARLLTEALHVRERARALEVDHIHVHFATESAIVALLARELGGPSYSITAHAKDIYRSTVRPELLERLFLGSAFVVTVCDANVDHLRARIGPEAGARVRRLYNGLDLPRFPFHGDGRDEDHVVAVGRLVEKKGFDVLIDALAELRRRGRTLRATLVGDGEERVALERRARERGLLEGTLTFTGPLDQDGVREVMQRATVFCLPCVVGEDGNRDALPTVLLEALAVGLPCVSTPVTGIPEILDAGRVGRVVPERDVEATATALEELLDSPEERALLARAGREHAEELFDARRASNTLGAWFQEAAQAASPREEVPTPVGD